MDNNIAFPLTGGVAGAGMYSTVGGVGLVGGFGGIGIGLMGMTTAGTVVGYAVYGAAEGISERDSTAFAAMGLGAAGGAGIYSTVGGIGISFGGGAFGIGINSMTAMGGIFGLGIYGLAKMFANSETKESVADTFNRMDEKISYMEAYSQAMMELNPFFQDLLWEQQFTKLEIDDELELLKDKIKENDFNLNWNISGNYFESNYDRFQDKNFYTEPETTEIEVSKKFAWREIKTLPGHLNIINSFAIKNNILASASDDKTVSLWNIETGRQIYTFFEPQEVLDVAISDRLIIAGGFNRKITSWKLNNKTLNNTSNQPLDRHDNVIYALTLNGKGDILISGSADKTIKIWNSITGSFKFTLKGHTDTIRDCL